MASAISEQGDLAYIVRNKPFDSQAIIEFLNHLMTTLKQKLLIIWDNASVIDIYDTREQSYLGSFFIEHRGKKRLSQMLLTDDYLFVLSGREMLRYRLAQAITKHFKKGEAENP